jgi:hypothetical protein
MLSLVIFFSSGCFLNNLAKPGVKVFSHEKPTTQPVDITFFQNEGCTWQTENYAACAETSVFKKMGCSAIYRPSEYYSLLTPSVPLVECNYLPLYQESPDQNPEGLYNSGCSMPSLMRLIAYQDGNYILVKNIADLQALFTPVESAEEALGYAVAATGAQPLFGFEAPKEYRYEVDTLDETFVKTIDGGYEVLLYDYQLCGCGPHSTYLTKIQVFTNGDINQLEYLPVFANPEDDGLCVD